MPVDDDYGRRSITLQQQQQHAPSPAPVPSTTLLQCTIGGCLSTSADIRYSSDKNLLESSAVPSQLQTTPATTTVTATTTATTSDRFGSERSNSDRLPSGERYQGVSERYPLGERPQTSISTERLLPKEYLHHQQLVGGLCTDDRYHYGNGTCQRYPERYTPVQNVNSLDRYHHTHTNTTTTVNNVVVVGGGGDRYSRTSTPTDRYHNIIDKDKITTNDRYDSYTPTERHRNITKIRERSSSSDRKNERYHHHHHHHHHHHQQPQYRYDHQYVERFPTIPCPERFATTTTTQQQQSYMEPPSPAPTNDRFIPPPPLSPDTTPSPDCFPNNSFPSPTTTITTPTEHFIPPPPLSPSPTEKFSPKKIERYDKLNRYQQQQHEQRYHQQQHHQRNQYYHERYVPPNAHMPVERYVPQQQQQQQQQQSQQQQSSQQQEAYCNNYQLYDRYTNKLGNNNDPYMRRDLSYNYRLPLPYPITTTTTTTTTNQYQRIRYQNIGTPKRIKCCQYQDNYQLSKSSPSSSSNSSVTSSHGTSLQDIQCQNYQNCYQSPVLPQQQQQQQQQEKSTQCNNKDCGFVSPNLRTINNNNNSNNNNNNSGVIVTKQCRHSICVSPGVEYVGASGGRHICATPPPPPRGSIGPTDGGLCNENCCNRRLTAQNTLAVTIWRTSTPVQQQQQPIPQQQQSPLLPQHQRTTTPIHDDIEPMKSTELPQNPPPTTTTTTTKPSTHVQRTVSLPPTSPPTTATTTTPPRSRQVNYSQSERLPNRPQLSRSLSKREMIKNFIKKETATFFGVDEDTEEEEQRQWLDRRIRMAERAYGPVKDEYLTLGRHRRAISEIPTQLQQQLGQLQAERPDVLPGPSDVPDTSVQERGGDVKLKRKDSVARMTWDGLSYVVNTLTRHRPRRRSQQSQLSRSFPPDTPYSSKIGEDQFFQRPVRTSQIEGIGDVVDHEPAELQPINYRERLTTTPTTTRPSYSSSSSSGGWRREPHVVLRHEVQNRPTVGGSRVYSSLLDNVLDNSNRRQYGMGWVGRMFGRSMRKSVTQDEKVRAQLDDMEDHRPMFTYWVTSVQILVLFISLICYGFGPFGIDLRSRSGQVLVTSLSLQQVDYMEPANFWFGPRAGDLIHLGAKFAPCMRIDEKILQEIDKIRAKERETACCIRNDDSGCVQSSQADCSKTISTWKKWSAGDAGPGGRISGSVCGLDPKFCDAPASVHPYEWPDDITKWPICRKTNTQFSIQKQQRPRDKIAEHMVCEVIGHPCCIGIHGQCKITTREYCDFVRGTFHEEASLCSQVSCLNDVCGMLPFYFPETPDQFYRLWTSLFLHAGILQLAITVIIQYYLMRDLEKLTGSLRIGIIYIGSGVAGNLASAIFVPYRADVGPAGSQFGLLACLIVEVLNAWPMLKHPNQALCKLLTITLFLFLIGLLPWVDNYAHLFGFVFGFLLSYALLPFISFGYYDRHKKIALIWICLLSASFLFICLILLFYIIPVYDCKICSYFNCIPFTNNFCASQNINFKKEEPIV